MRSTIATYKESLSRIAGDVLDAAADIDGPPLASPFTAQRSSHRLAQLGGSPASNGHAIEIEHHKAEVERLQASEAEIKALAINYAALLKEKECHKNREHLNYQEKSQLSRLHEENSSLRKSLEVKNGTSPQARYENLKSAKSTSVGFKVTSKQSPTKQQNNTSQASPRSSGNSSQKNTLSRQDTLSNGGVRSAFGSPTTQSQKELEALLEEKNKALAEIQDHHESEIRQLMLELKNERQISADFKSKFSDEQRRSSSSQKDLHDLKLENERTFIELKDLQKRLDSKISEIGHLQAEMSRRNSEKDSDNTLQSLQTSIATLQEENSKLKLEKERLAAALHLAMKNDSEKNADNSESLHNMEQNFNKEKEEMLVSFQQLERALKDTHTERDKAQRELARLKQHLLDKELEESEKMDEDSKVIEELRAISEHQKTHILKLEKALRQEVAMHDKTKTTKSDDIQRLTETVDDLSQQLANYMNIVETKNVELLNLQTALGQYYAESEARGRLERDLAASREEFTRIFDTLKVAKQENQLIMKEKEDMSIRLSQAERMLQESKHTIQKLQEDNSKLHRAVEQSMTRINRMSMDSDFYVDRRIVIKLLVTYFQRNHSKEVLDLMVRMLGFSDEDKQRIGFAQQTAGKGAVRGVLGLPGRLVGGILGGKTPASSEVPSENQSFADLWVDFLLKETEQRGRLEAESVSQPSSTQEKSSATTFGSLGTTTPSQSSPLTQYPSANRFASPFPRQKQPFEPDSEFATVPLSSSASPSTESGSRLSRLLQR